MNAYQWIGAVLLAWGVLGFAVALVVDSPAKWFSR